MWLLTRAQDRGDYTGISAAIHDSHNPEWPELVGVSDEVVPFDLEPQWSRGQVGTEVAVVRKICQQVKSIQKLIQNPTRGARVETLDVRMDFFEIAVYPGVKGV